MKKDLIKKKYKKKIDLINNYNQKYYNKNFSKITDESYDLLKKEIIDLENNHKFLKDKNSPSITVGYKPSKNFNKVPHKVPMLSLANGSWFASAQQLTVGPASTIVGSFILNTILVELAGKIKNIKPFPFYISSNMPNAKSNNNVLIKKYKKLNKHL